MKDREAGAQLSVGREVFVFWLFRTDHHFGRPRPLLRAYTSQIIFAHTC